MKQLNERFSEETLRQLMGLYIINTNSECFPLVPSEKPLTVDNFGLLEDDVIYTAEDFRWCEEDGSNRDLVYGDIDYYLYDDDLPDEVFCLLNTVICTKFATRHLDDAKAMLDLIEDNELRAEVEKGIADFAKATDSKRKLQIARTALFATSNAFDNINKDISNKFGYAAIIIEKVLLELADRCQ